MFGHKTKSTRHYGDGTVVTTTSRSKRTTPHSTSGFMARLRPRRSHPPAYTSAPVVTTGHHTTTSPVHTSRTGFGRRKHTHHNGHRHHHATATTTTTAVPARKTSLGDKVSGAMMRLRGEVTGRPGVKGAGTRRMHGTDGRAPRRYY